MNVLRGIYRLLGLLVAAFVGADGWHLLQSKRPGGQDRPSSAAGTGRGENIGRGTTSTE
ncbi:hypothetical protein ACIQU6_39720 [Streptomyces sp. NPDC090442]|uniref:hypothetical protein n=1 Tax=Streptomyces sp. NPDC090442 TaxID=3365962 RepID=UPI00381313DC